MTSHGGGRKLERWKLAGAAATAVIAVMIPLSLVIDPGGPAIADDPADPTFVGRERCADCHQAATEAWRGSDHDLAMDVATDETVLGDFDDATFTAHGITSRFYRSDGGGFFVHTEGPGGEMGDFEITHTFGHDPLQQYLVPFRGGRLQCLPIAWDRIRGEWFHLYPDRDISPDDWMHWTRNAQNWNGMCAECHSTNLKKGYDHTTRSFDTSWFEIDVGCEACHGPGSAHVMWAELPPMARPAGGDGLVVPTSGISPPEQVELCAPCHSRRAELGDFTHSSLVMLDSLVPSLLDEGLYHSDGQILDEVYVYGSFLQSKMYANDVRCTDCHDAHSLELRFDGNELCGQCHRLDTYDSADHHFHKKVVDGEPSAGALCVSCHMPEQPYMVIDWRADHSFRVPRPDLTRSIGTPNACGQAGCHADKSLDWQIDEYETWYGRARKPHYGTILAAGRALDPEAQPQLIRLAGDPLYPAIVRATALSLLGGYPPDDATTSVFDQALAAPEPIIRRAAVDFLPAATLERVVEALAPLLFDEVRGVRTLAASRLAGAPDELLEGYQRERLAEVIIEHVSDMEYSLDFASAGHNLGNLYAQLGDTGRAIEFYRAALEVDDLFLPAKMNLAVLLNTLGRNDEAEMLLREVLSDYPDNGQAAYSLGLLLAEMGRMTEAADALVVAAQLQPDRARTHYNLGLALQSVGRIGEAAGALRRAVELEPANLDFLFGLADHLARSGDLEGAIAVADQMIVTHPDNPLGRDLKTQLESLRGRPR